MFITNVVNSTIYENCMQYLLEMKPQSSVENNNNLTLLGKHVIKGSIGIQKSYNE